MSFSVNYKNMSYGLKAGQLFSINSSGTREIFVFFFSVVDKSLGAGSPSTVTKCVLKVKGELWRRGVLSVTVCYDVRGDWGSALVVSDFIRNYKTGTDGILGIPTTNYTKMRCRSQGGGGLVFYAASN